MISNNNSLLRTENIKIRSLEHLLICLHSTDSLPGCTKRSREGEGSSQDINTYKKVNWSETESFV